MGERVEKWREVEDVPTVSGVWGKNEEESKMRESTVTPVRKKMKKKKSGRNGDRPGHLWNQEEKN